MTRAEPEQVLFLGTCDGVPDGELVLHLDAAYRSLCEALGSRPVHSELDGGVRPVP